MSENLLTDQTGVLEKYQWFVRSHLADWAGGMANAGADSGDGCSSGSRCEEQPKCGANQ